MSATHKLTLTLTACLALVAAGCGGEEDDSAASDNASLAYKACYDDCIKKGGDAKGCKTRCSQASNTDPIKACHDDCTKKGGSDKDCRTRCAQAGSSTDPFKACYDGCIKKGYSDKDCRTRCSGR